jgi:hypothetical protein
MGNAFNVSLHERHRLSKPSMYHSRLRQERSAIRTSNLHLPTPRKIPSVTQRKFVQKYIKCKMVVYIHTTHALSPKG